MPPSKKHIVAYITVFIIIVIISIIITITLNNRESVVPEESKASNNNGPKFVAASLCSAFTSTDPAELERRARELVNVDGIHCRMLWNDVQTGPNQYNYEDIGQWIRQNYQYNKKSVIGFMLRSDYIGDCTTSYQSTPKFVLNNSTYDPIPGNRYTASWGDDSGEGSCDRGTPFSWDIPYKQVNYTNSNVKNELRGMIDGFAAYLRTTDLNPGSGNGLKLIDAMGGVEIAVGHQGEPRPIWTNRGARSTPSSPVPSGQWQACPSSGYNPNTPELYSDWCHYVWKWGNGNQYSASTNWVNWQSWLVDTYQNAFGSSLPMYIDSVGALAGNGENSSALQHAASLGVGSKSTGISANQGPGSGVEYRDGELNYGNWWNVLRKHWDDALKPPMVVEHGTSVIPVFNSIGNQKNPNQFYWMVLAGLSYHVDQFHLLSSMIQPSFRSDPNSPPTGYNIGLNDEFLAWAKPYTGADREDSPGAFTVLRENALLQNKVTDWFSNSETRTKWQAGTDTGCYYCDRGFGPSLDSTTFNTSTAYGGNYDFFMSSDNGRGEQNIPLWDYNRNYSPVNGGVDPNFPKEGMFYRRTDKATNRNEFCFDVEDRFRSIRGGSGNYTVVVKYKNDSVVFDLAHKNGVLPQVSGTGDGKWKSTTFNLTNATFNNDFVSAGGRSYDFCVRRVSGSDLALHMVEVKPEGSGTPPTPTVSNPTFSPVGGTYTSAQTVTISTQTTGATIRYTLDGSTPTTTTGTIYSAPITISSTTTLKAMAYKTGSNPSSVSTATYTINTGGTTPPSSQFDITIDSGDHAKTIITPDKTKLLTVGVKWNPNVRQGIPECDGSTTYGLCGNGDIYLTIIDLNSRTKVSETLIAGDPNSSTILNQEHPNIIYNSVSNEYLVAWQELPANANRSNFNGYEGSFEVGYDIYAQRVTLNGNTVTNAGSKLGVSTEQDSQWVPQIAHNSDDNEYLLTWHDHRNRGNAGVATQKDIYAQRLGYNANNLTLLGTNFSITKNGNNNALYYQEYSGLVYDNTNDKYLGVWADNRTTTNSNYHIWGQFISRTGSFMGSNFAIINQSGIQSATYPKLALLPSGQGFVLVWNQVTNSSSKNAGLAILNRDGIITSGPTNLSIDNIPSSGYSTNPEASCGEEDCSVVWREDKKFAKATFISSPTPNISKSHIHTGTTYFNNMTSTTRDNITVNSFLQNSTMKIFVSGQSGTTPPVNQAPVVNAGVDQTITLPSSVSLVGTATDDGLPNPPATLTKTWSKVAGAGTVTFSAVNNLSTTVSFSLAGVYTLRLTVTDSVLITADDVVVTVNSAPPAGTVSNPTFNPSGGTYTSAQTVAITTTTVGATIRYTTNGTDPTTTAGTIYSGAVSISSTTTLKAIAYKEGMSPSSVSSAVYTINIPPSQVVAPTFNPLGGTYTTTQTVSISSLTSGATIRYTTNGSTPTPTTGTIYSVAVSISSTTTLKAIAYKSGMSDSSVTTAIYTINTTPQPGTIATPVINPNGGTFTSAQSVTITTVTAGASIRYTTNGSDPTESSSLYTIPLTISSTTTLKARAFKTGMNPSSIASATFTINPPQGITEYNVVGTISFRYDNIPVTVTIKNGSTVVKTVTLNSITADNRIEFRLNANEVGAGNYTVVIKPRYYTAREGTLTLATSQNVTFSVSGDYYGGKYTTTNPDRITILDVSRFLVYFRAGDHTKDLNGDGRINILDIVVLLNGFRATVI